MKIRVLLSALLVLTLPSLLFAGGVSSSPAAIPAPQSAIPGPDIDFDGAYGGNWTATWLPASAFSARTGVDFQKIVPCGDYSYICTNAAPAGLFWAPVNLPTGAELGVARFYYFDSSAVNDPWFVFTRMGTVSGDYQDMYSGVPSGTPGETDMNIITTPYPTIDNFNNAYVAYVYLPSDGTNIRFKGVRLYWRTKVSPAPATATFLDVPTSHPFFRFVEALAASGITSGCGGGNFCPNSAVTRGQMAVFLASALGLHWPD